MKGLGRRPVEFSQRPWELVVCGLQEIQLEWILTAERCNVNCIIPSASSWVGAHCEAHLVQLLLRVLQVLLGWEQWISRIGFHQLCNSLDKSVEGGINRITYIFIISFQQSMGRTDLLGLSWFWRCSCPDDGVWLWWPLFFSVCPSAICCPPPEFTQPFVTCLLSLWWILKQVMDKWRSLNPKPTGVKGDDPNLTHKVVGHEELGLDVIRRDAVFLDQDLNVPVHVHLLDGLLYLPVALQYEAVGGEVLVSLQKESLWWGGALGRLTWFSVWPKLDIWRLYLFRMSHSISTRCFSSSRMIWKHVGKSSVAMYSSTVINSTFECSNVYHCKASKQAAKEKISNCVW